MDKLSKDIIDTYINCFLNPANDMLNIPEYGDAIDKILLIIQRGGRGTLRPEIDKIILLGFDAIIILCHLKLSCVDMLNEMIEKEQYEICVILRDIITTIENELLDYENTPE